MNSLLRILCLLVIAFFSNTGLYAYGSKAIGFVRNQGQVLDQNRKINSDVKYIYEQGNFSVIIRANGFSYQQLKFKPGKDKGIKIPAIKGAPTPVCGDWEVYRIDISFSGSNPRPEILENNIQSSYLNYYNEHVNTEKVSHCKGLTLSNIYPGIDLELSCTDGFKYNFRVHQGASPDQIKMKFDGITGYTLKDKTHLLLQTPLGEIIESIPASYITYQGKQSKTQVEYVLLGKGVFGFQLPEKTVFDELLIDPLPWATYFGGASYENGNTIDTDSLGNSYVAGYTYSPSGIATSGAFHVSFGGNNDGFLCKLNSEGNLLWSTYFGGSDNDYVYSIDISASGFIIITGFTGSASGIVSNAAVRDTIRGTVDAFVAKFNEDGSRIWTEYFGGYNLDYAFSVYVDLNDDIIITGYTNSIYGMATSGAQNATFGGLNDVFIAKFNINGVLIWSTYMGGNSHDFGSSVVCDSEGDIYITGFTSSSNGIASSGAFQSNLAGFNNTYDAFLCKYSNDGQKIWGTYLGGEYQEEGRALAIAPDNSLYILGITQSATGIASNGSYQSTFKGQYDAFISKFDTSGMRIWSTYLGGDGNDYAVNLAIAENGSPVMIGFTDTRTGITFGNVHQTSMYGPMDAWLSKLDSSGSMLWSTYYGGNGEEYGNGIAIGAGNSICGTGITNSTNRIAYNALWMSNLAGTNDAFIFSLSPNGNLNPVSNNVISGNQTLCEGIYPNLFSASLPMGGSGSYTFLWVRSATGNTGVFNAAPGNNTLLHYSPPPSSVTYWYKRIVFSGGDSDSSNVISVKINPKPHAGIIVQNGNSQCVKGNSFVFSHQGQRSDSITQHLWDFGENNNDTSRLEFPVKSYLLSGTYSINHWVQNKWGCRDSAIQQVLINPAPVIIAFTNEPNIFCEGNSILIQCNQLPGIKYTWLKDFVKTGDSSFYITKSESGSYRVIQTNSLGCSDTSNEIKVTVQPIPSANIKGDPYVVNCLAKDQFYKLESQSKGDFFYQWQKNNVDIPAANQSYFQTAIGGKFKLWIRNNFGCTDTSAEVELILNNPPLTQAIGGKDSVSFLNATQQYSVSGNASNTYHWLVNHESKKNSSESFFTYTFEKAGEFEIELIETSPGNCSSDTSRKQIHVYKTQGLDNPEAENILIFPNPANQFIQINCKPNPGTTISLVDAIGKVIFETKSQHGEISWPTGDLADGLYFIKFENFTGSITKKIIIHH